VGFLTSWYFRQNNRNEGGKNAEKERAGMKASRLVFAWVVTLAPVWAQTTTVTVSPTAAAVHLGTSYQFSDTVTGNTNRSVSWSVVLPAGATGSAGSISTGGTYYPPATMPSSSTVTVVVTSVAVPTAAATATITLENAFPTVASVEPISVPVGAFSITVNGANFVKGAVVNFGATALATTYVSATRLTAAGTALPNQNNHRVPVTVTNPAPGSATSVDDAGLVVGTTGCKTALISTKVAARFLEQAAFGPDAATVVHVACIGLAAYLQEQLTTAPSPYPDPSTTGTGLGQVQSRFFVNAVHGPDQLRQRVAFALGEIFVVSGIEENTPTQLVPFLRILQNDGFKNFRTLMEDVTLSPTMGEYLDMRNNDKANPVTGTRANENYARELLQLFTIGLFELNSDGSLMLDSQAQPIATYDQTTIQNFAKIYTGWTYPTQPGKTLQKHNPAYYTGPMAAYEGNHDTTSKILLNGLSVPANGTAATDLKAALDNIFNHQNVGPFISKQLIQHLVTSNPTAAYVARVAAVFHDNGSKVRGDMTAVVKAILQDPEARADDNGPATASPDKGGHLREPVLLIPAVLRGLGTLVNDTNNLTNLASGVGQTLFSPPTVFNYFAPGYLVPGQFTPGLTLSGPEFQLETPSAAVSRYNVINSIVFGNLGAGAVTDLTPFSNLGTNPTALLTLVSNTFFHGNMPAVVNSEILSAITAIPETSVAANLQRAQAAIYLAVSSSYYTVEH
jgi:uncharacterized protein (DUF1800 family)